MSDSTLDVLTQRVGRLERENPLCKRVVIASLAGVSLILLLGALARFPGEGVEASDVGSLRPGAPRPCISGPR
jgi:hypothetical protein